MTIVSWVVSRLSRKGRGISILIPFRCTDPTHPRVKNAEWLKRYWKVQLPGAQIVMGDDPTDQLFSKAVAVNNAAAKATGDVFVIIDADGYMSADSVLYCAEEIRTARKKNKKLWFVPYRQFYRLTEEASRNLLQSNPASPFPFSEPLASSSILACDTDPKVGHWYGAMVQIMPREAFEAVGGWDGRFRGWGGEDHAAMRAMDTLYGLHKTLPGQVLHIWHPQIGPQGTAVSVPWNERMWEGQDHPGINDRLSYLYYGAYGRFDRMRKLVDGGHDAPDDKLTPITHRSQST